MTATYRPRQGQPKRLPTQLGNLVSSRLPALSGEKHPGGAPLPPSAMPALAKQAAPPEAHARKGPLQVALDHSQPRLRLSPSYRVSFLAIQVLRVLFPPAFKHTQATAKPAALFKQSLPPSVGRRLGFAATPGPNPSGHPEPPNRLALDLSQPTPPSINLTEGPACHRSKALPIADKLLVVRFRWTNDRNQRGPHGSFSLVAASALAARRLAERRP